MILHTVNKSPFASQCLAECLAACSPGDAILLLEDGVYGAVKTLPSSAPRGFTCYALTADIDARGLANRIHPDIQLTDDRGFVLLTTQYDKVISWY